MRGVIVYVLLCVISILAGQGVLNLLKLQLERRPSLFLAPTMTMVLWTLTLGAGISFGLPVKHLWKIGWLLVALMALYGVWGGDDQSLKGEWGLLAVSFLLPVCLMSAFFWHDITTYLGSSSPDGWSYIAYGRYLWDHPRGTEGGLAPLYQYAAHLNGTRFIASSLLGLFSPAIGSPGDTQAASGYFLAWAIFVFCSSCMFLGVSRGFGRKSLIVYVSISVFSGWLLNALRATNYDNILAISFLPTFAGVIHLMDSRNRRWGIVLGGLTAAVLYCYPEVASFVLGGAVLFLSQRILSEGKSIRNWLILLSGAVVLAGILVAPLIDEIARTIFGALNEVMKRGEVRPGEGFFPELLSPKYRLMALWGLGGKAAISNGVLGRTWDYIRTLLALLLSILAAYGTFELSKRKEPGLAATIILLLVSSLVMLFYFVYSYGAYKFILLNWWGMSFTVIMGFRRIMSRAHENRYRWRLKFCFASLTALFLLVNGLRVISFDRAVSQKSILPFKQLEKIKSIVGNEPIVVAIDETLANAWAVYFLRDALIYLSDYRHYMAQPHVIPYMRRATPMEIPDARYILADSIGLLSFPKMSAAWSGGPYYVWELTSKRWLVVNSLKNPNGVEEWGGERGFWMGEGDTEIGLLSSKAGQAAIKGQFILGPSLPKNPRRQILITTDREYNNLFTLHGDGPQTIFFPVEAGSNKLILRTLDRPTLNVLPTGDTRPLVLGVRGLKISLEENNR